MYEISFTILKNGERFRYMYRGDDSFRLTRMMWSVETKLDTTAFDIHMYRIK